jgi:hypothetical protein
MVQNILSGFGPLSDYGVFHVGKALGWKMSPSSSRSRRAELTKASVVRDSGKREVTPSGRKAIVWESVA